MIARALVVALAGCTFTHGGAAIDGAPGASVDGRSGDDALGGATLGTCVTIADLGVNLCPMDPPGPALEIATTTAVKTDDGSTMPPDSAIKCAMLTKASAPNVCAIYAQSITIDAGVTLSASGGKPLVLLGDTSIDIEGTLDVASHLGAPPGAGSPHPMCSPGKNPSGGGGGQGGSYATAGGNGGDAGATAMTGGTAGSALAADSLAGGCPGAPGDGAAMGGAGGGAVLLATPLLLVGDAGQIDASGAAGRGGTSGARAGGGAGSGGMIAVAAGAITLAAGAQLYANGSHGGGGASATTTGSDGSDPAGAVSGGGGGAAGGTGGSGSAGALRGTPAVDGAAGVTAGASGGGGGGGAGVVYIRPAIGVVAGDSNVSPAPI
ncbi:MAG TPA: hypothetical protein VLX92_34635 [Kofleriaceae bacterium]|nr:hypothetical protein [Kofleriaceae bacterium]